VAGSEEWEEEDVHRRLLVAGSHGDS
jgi:hypothetical protein